MIAGGFGGRVVVLGDDAGGQTGGRRLVAARPGVKTDESPAIESSKGQRLSRRKKEPPIGEGTRGEDEDRTVATVDEWRPHHDKDAEALNPVHGDEGPRGQGDLSHGVDLALLEGDREVQGHVESRGDGAERREGPESALHALP